LKQYIKQENQRTREKSGVLVIIGDKYQNKKDINNLCMSKVMINRKEKELLEKPNHLTRIKNVIEHITHPIKTTWQFKYCKQKIITDYKVLEDFYGNTLPTEEYQGLMNQDIQFKESNRIEYEKKQMIEKHAQEIQEVREMDYDIYVSNNIYY
jgi:rRNA processing protein Krr1/Pno1